MIRATFSYCLLSFPPHPLKRLRLKHKGFSAGSYKDLTRVAWLNPQMWAELFMENKDNVLFELDSYMESLSAYRDAIAADDMDTLVRLLDEGKKRKEEVDG